MKNHNKYLFSIFAVIGYIFLESGYGKISGGKFVGSLGATLTKFASGNPYPAVKGFLENIAIPNSVLFGYLTQWGEFLAGLNLLGLSVLMLFSSQLSRKYYWLMSLGFGTGLLLNVTFWLSAGYSSPSTGSLNLLMAAVNLVGLIFVISQSKSK